MPKSSTTIPKFSRHLRGQAFVKIAGQQIWLGRYGDPLARQKYDRVIAKWLANGRTLPQAPPPEQTAPTVLEILAPYWRWAKERYFGGELHTIKGALRIAEKLYGASPATGFGPNALRAVRAEMVRKGWTRKYINRQVLRVQALFRWAASYELLPESVYAQLCTLEPLRHGEAVERPKVRPVPRRLIRSIRHRISRQVRALIDLQLLTAARADELVRLRTVDIDCTHAVWRLNPDEHKTAHHDKERWIYFGPRAQKILKMFMTPERPAGGYLFSPREAEAERHAAATGHRRPNQKPNTKKTAREVGEHYTTCSYRRVIHRALAEVYPAPRNTAKDQVKKWRQEHTWGPHRLRHNAGTFLRREFGIEVARAILGHSSAVTTLIYAEADERRAVQAMAKVG